MGGEANNFSRSGSFFATGEEKGKDGDDKRTAASVKGRPLQRYCRSLWPF